MTKDNKKPLALKSVSRRKAVKQIVGGVSAIAAYNMLPVRWEKPIIEQIFLPAHAAVSGITLSDPCTAELVSGNQESSIDVIRVSGFVTPPVAGLEVTVVATPNGGSGGPVTVKTSTGSDGTYSAEVTMVGGPGIVGVGATTTVAGVTGVAHCPVGIPPADHPSAQRPQQPPSTTPTITVDGTPFSCGDDIQGGPGVEISNSYSAQITPPPDPTGQQVTVEFYLNGNLQIITSVRTKADGSTSEASFRGAVAAGTTLTCRFTYDSNVSAECSNLIEAP